MSTPVFAPNRRIIATLTALGAMALAFYLFSQKIGESEDKKSDEEPIYLTAPTSVMNDIAVHKTSATVLLSQLKNSEAKVTLVNLWATWCGPCVEEIPELVALQKKYKPSELDVMLVSVDGIKLLPKVHESLAALGVDFDTYIRTDDDKVFIENIYPGWSGALPATILFSKTGKRLDAWMGAKTFKEFEQRIKKHL